MSQKSILSFFAKTPVKPVVRASMVTPPPIKRSPVQQDDSDSERCWFRMSSQHHGSIHYNYFSGPLRLASSVGRPFSIGVNFNLTRFYSENVHKAVGRKKRYRIVSSSEEGDTPEKKEQASSPKRPSLNKSAKDEVDSPKTTKREKDPDTSASSDDVKPNPVALQTKKSPNQSAKKKTKTTPSPKATKTNGGKDKKPSAKPSKSPPAKSIKKESPKSVKKEEDETTTTTASPTAAKSIPADEPPAKGIASFFTLKKEMKVQAAGSGHKGVDYNPAKAKYHPVDDAFWNEGEKVPYLALTKTFAQIEEISGRLKMIEVLANFFRSVIVLSPGDLVQCMFLCQNQLAPAYEGLELGVAETSLMKVIAQTTGRTLAQVRTDAKESGDLGLVAEQSKSNQRMMFVPAPLTVAGVFAKLTDIAKMTGTSSSHTKVDKIQGIFVACRHSEARYFIRSLLGKLRIGLAEQSVLQALALACTLTPPDQQGTSAQRLFAVKGEAAIKSRLEEVSLIIKTTYCQCPNIGRIVQVLLSDGGVDALLTKCQMMPGTPLKPMLAHPTKGISEVLQRFDGIKFTCEWKYDGERAQIHINDAGVVSIYSRNQENNTTKYPDIIGRVADVKGAEVRSCILDCEAVAWDTEKRQIMPFQVLSTRKRKDATEADIKVQVCVFMFDLLYLNGEPLVTRPFQERRALLQQHFRVHEGEWQMATSLDTSDVDELQHFLEVSIKGNCEGLMVKTLEQEATYEIAKRSRNWLKIKKDYLSGVGDSLDLVVIGGYVGKGKRTGTYGGFLLACYDADNEQYQSICKIGTGFSDDDLGQHTDFLKPHVIKAAKSYYAYDGSHEPDAWFEPVQVWEVLCADLSLSPVHQAAKGIIDPEKGISLRFPRFIRVRDDKGVEDATSAQQVADMYSNQDQIKNQDKANKDFEEDFY